MIQCLASEVSCHGPPLWQRLLPSSRGGAYCSTVSTLLWSVTFCYVGAGAPEPEAHVMFMYMYVMASQLLELGLVRRGDILLLNEGLWHSPQRSRKVLHSILNSTTLSTELRSPKRKKRRGATLKSILSSVYPRNPTIAQLMLGDDGVLLAWRETSPQHFPASPTGSFDGFIGYRGSMCAPLQVPQQNAELSSLLASLERAGMPIIRILNLTVSQWDTHLENRTLHIARKTEGAAVDCTHFCEPSGVMEAWADATLLVVERTLHRLAGPWR